MSEDALGTSPYKRIDLDTAYTQPGAPSQQQQCLRPEVCLPPEGFPSWDTYAFSLGVPNALPGQTRGFANDQYRMLVC